ncbi:MAG TPA: hypothetical protein VHV51_06530 [Polyangiaceae bacterium]|nr:hypothetical protein [Polyangiaceae bacterium]
MTRASPLLFFFGVGASVILPSRTSLAKSDLASDVKALVQARSVYGRVVQLKPRLLERGERLPLAIPPELLNPKEASCTTVSVLGVEGLHFVVRFSEFDPGAPSTAFPESSAVGAIEITRCGAGKPFLGDISLELRSPRGVIETLVSNAPAGVPPLTETLPNRDPGMELALGDPGPRPALGPVSERVQQIEARAHRDGATSFIRAQARAGEDGSGAAVLPLLAGCHELTLLDQTPTAPGASPGDLDLELVDSDSGAALAVDRAEDPDASGVICLGTPRSIELRFIGAAPNAHLVLTHARWDLPAGVPTDLGPEARARLAGLARAAHFSPRHSPLYQSIGVQGTTELPFEIEPNACYTVLLGPLRGEVQSLSLSALAHASGQAARGAADTNGSAVSFCARGARVATLEVDGRGTNLAWFLAVWETGRMPPGSAAP